MSDFTILDRAIRRQVLLEQVKAGSFLEFKGMLKKLEELVRGKLGGNDITKWARRQLDTELTLLEGALSEVSKDVKSVWLSQVTELVDLEADYELDTLAGLKEMMQVEFAAPSGMQVLAAVMAEPMQATGVKGLLLTGFFDTWDVAMKRNLIGAVRIGYAQGLPTEKIVSSIFKSGGAYDLTRKQLKAVVHTSLQTAANVARNQIWEANDDIIVGVRIIATLDGKTSEICRSLDQKVFPLREGPRPPFHVLCRTSTIAELNKKYKDLQQGRDRMARNSVTGKSELVDGTISYYEWLKKQSVDFQDSVIGPSRGALLRNGGIDANKFGKLQLNKEFLPITLAEMKIRNPKAFKKANVIPRKRKDS